MSLIENMMEQFCYVEKVRTPDGAGGFLVNWTDGAKFDAAITLSTTMEARRAEHDGMTSVYTVTTSKNVHLDYYDVIRRLSDGRTFRITSDSSDKHSPSTSTLDIAQANAERWELTS